jgi:signal transduction histidine kinase/ligand-binding sensor domain-containing protein
MKNELQHYLVILFFFFTWEVSSQTREVRFNLVTTADGLQLCKSPQAITQDRYGFLWVADQSQKAIFRYDGHYMKMYRNDFNNPNSLGGHNPECLATDSLGNIWIGFYGKGLDKFDPVTGIFTHYRHDPKDGASLSSDVVSALLVDHLGNVWVGSNGGLDLFDSKTGKFKNYKHHKNDSTSLSYDVVRAIYEDKSGELWVGTGPFFSDAKFGGLNRFHRNSQTFTRYISDPANPQTLIDNRVKAIFEDSYGTFWVGTNGDGLHTLERKTGLFKRLTHDPKQPELLSRPPLISNGDHISFITEDSDKQIWIGTIENGLTRYDPITKKITRYGNNDDRSNGVKIGSSWNIYPASDGLLWLMVPSEGLVKIDINNTIIPHVDMTGTVWSVYEQGDSIGWYATEKGLVRKDYRKGSSRVYVHDPANPNSLSNSGTTGIRKDKTGNLWIGTYNGLNHFNVKTEKFTRYNDNVNAQNPVSGLYEDSDSTLWLAYLCGGLEFYNWKTGKRTYYLNDPNDLNSISWNCISAFYKDDSNDLWLGTIGWRGLNKLDRTSGKFKLYLPGIYINCIYRDASGIMWVGAGSGLYYYNKPSDSFIEIDNEISGSLIGAVMAITGDKEDNLWMSTSNWIYMLNRKRDQWYHYGKEYGFIRNEFTSGSSFTRYDGEIILGDPTGYYAFYPEKLKTIASNNTPLYFTGFWLNNKVIIPGTEGPLKMPLNQTKEIRLDYNQNVFSFSATYIDFRNTQAKYIHYKLDQFDIDWRKAKAEDEIQYIKVPPGKYIFRIKVDSNSERGWIEKSIVVIIAQPWWNTWQAYIVYALLFMASIFSIHKFQRNRLIHTERERARERELVQAKEIEKAYTELKATQAQLIQSEKMASLGELTAGIAHEIQNPLNFINNFSEVNSELVSELVEEVDKGNTAEVKLIAADIKENSEKINHHGKRADAIVKGMLQHSRSSSGVKEPTDINALAEEYLRLAYHGLKAKDNSFNATLHTDFDETIGDVSIIPQDIGRVLLNIINNAFHAVGEKKKSGVENYEPTVSISTKKDGDNVLICIKDNGNGIPQRILDKIFQPFFTTKPTGQGTGLGLSLSYDIVKAHGGEIKVETLSADLSAGKEMEAEAAAQAGKERVGSAFIIQLPVKK